MSHALHYTRAEGTEEQSLHQRQAQFQILVTKMHPRLYHFARRTLRHPQDAEDVTQETLARAWSHFETFDAQRPFEAWVFRIARNLLIDQSRRRRYRQEVSLETSAMDADEDGRGKEGVGSLKLADPDGDPESCLLAKEISAELQGALGGLSPLHQETLRLVAQQRSYEQIARVLDCPVGTVRSRVYRARIMLRHNLKVSTVHDDTNS